MKTTSRPKASPKQTSGLQAEYEFNYARSKPNRFAAQPDVGSLSVVLDPDVARVFQNGESVNAVLRALLATMPPSRMR
ncbi:MAG: hypothetical protein IT162_06265 [Bryobacterales bacterium]|nr:hypothetical protein [Bryobacterales bacterium]